MAVSTDGILYSSATLEFTASTTKWHLLSPQEVRIAIDSAPLVLTADPKSPEARPAPKPQPIGSFPFILLLTTAMVCVLFILWRRSDALRTVVSHQCVQTVSSSHLFFSFVFLFRLKTWTRQEGAVRLSEDDGPPAHLFLEDDEEQDEEIGGDEGPPPVELQRVAISRDEVTDHETVPPVPPPKDRI